MERNMMEILAKIDLITIEKAAADRNDHNLKEFLEEICCKNRIKVECHDHFLHNCLMFILHENLKYGSPDIVYGTSVVIADIAKNDIGREYLSDNYLVCLLVDKMKSERDYFIRLQTCRALANMCYENSKTQRLIMGQDPLPNIFTLLNLSSTPFRRENCERFKEVIVALILNLLADNQSVAEEVADKYVSNLVEALECDLKNQVPTALCHSIFVAIVALAEVKPSDLVFTLRLCVLVVDMYRRTSVYDYALPGLEFLEDSEICDLTKFNLVEAGLFDIFMWVLDHKPENLREDERKKYGMLGRILANVLTADEAMSYIYNLDDANVINRFGDWLLSADKDIVHAGALCLGNIARTDSNSITIVERGIHKNLIRIVGDNVKNDKLLYSIVCTLRNLCLPKANKRRLIDDGMIGAFLPLLDLEIRSSSPTIYKAIGAVRQIMEDQEDVATALGSDTALVRQLVNWSTTTLLPWVSTECSRFLCSLVNVSKSRDVIINMLENRAYVQMSRTLVALHGLMQKEALKCMTITLRAAVDEENRMDFIEMSDEEFNKSELLANFHLVLIQCQLAEKLKHLVAQHGIKMELDVLEQLFTFLDVANTIEPLRSHLYYEGFKGVFRNVMRNRVDYEQIKPRIDKIETACRMF